MQNFLDELNDSQREAVVYSDGPQLVIAGAGSGKTRVLTYKIAYLLKQGYKPWNILALTFTNKAAREMKERIGALVGIDTARYLNMGTFHSIFARILRIEAVNLGYEPNFTIYDEADSRSLLKAIIKEMELDDKTYKPATVHSRISMAKNKLIFPDQYKQTRGLVERDHETHMPAMSDIYSVYCQRCQMANAMDFDDLLTNTFILFNKNDDIRCKYAERFQYILVDEYQDTNSVQQRIVSQLSAEHQHVCAVGDDAQSIYAFRGANIDNILDFQQQFQGTRLFKLEQNYRSTQNIVKAANSLISHNERQIRKDVYSHNDEGEKLVLKPSYSDKEEAIIVCNEIKRLRRNESCDYSNFAILYRTNSQSRSFEEAMRKVNIPYRIYGGLGFYQRKEIKDIIAYFRMVANPDDEEAFKRIINYPKRGIGDTTVAKIAGLASAKGISLWAVINNPDRYGLTISKATATKIDGFRQLINSFIERFPTSDAYTLGIDIVKTSGISAEIYADKTPENVVRQENLEEFLAGMQDFVESRKEEDRENEVLLTDFLQEVSLLTDVESNDNAEQGKVSLMTIHSAKGLEFPTVFIVGMEENIFPSPMSADTRRGLEEERRLFYVAITRAERHCILTYAQNRFRYGRMENESPSRFLRDIDPNLLRIDNPKDVFMQSSDGFSTRHYQSSNRGFSSFQNKHTSYHDNLSFSKNQNRWQNSRPVASQFRADLMPCEAIHREDKPITNTFSPRFEQLRAAAASPGHKPSTTVSALVSTQAKTVAQTGTLQENCIIEHERFGIGRIIRLEGSGENQKATVEFKNAGVKQLLLKFARFKIIG